MGLTPGRLRQRVSIMRKTETDNGKGGRTTTYPVYDTVWAEVIGMNGREALLDHVMQGISFFRVTIRWRDDLLDTDQLKYGEIDLNIRSAIDPDGMREQTVIMADTSSAIKTS